MKIFILPAFLFIQSISAQESTVPLAIDFKNIPFEEAKRMAHQTGKAIFIDLYAEWCIPCKQFEKTVFTDTAVGNKFNNWFVNLKIDGEKEEGKKLFKQYNVGGYPTGIFINSNGVLLSKFEGVLPKATFISYGENALIILDDPHGYEKALSLYHANNKDLSTVRNLIQKAILSGNQLLPEVMDFYFGACSKTIFRSDSVVLKKWISTNPTVIAGKESYNYFLKNTALVKNTLVLDDKFLNTFFYNSLQTATQNAAANKLEHELALVLKLNVALPSNLRQAENIDYEMDYYLEVKDFENYISKMNRYCKSAFAKIDSKNSNAELAARINNFGWNYLLYATTKNDLVFAELFMQKCIALDSSFAAWYDTYSGIVYKQGDTLRAIEIEKKAVILSQQNDAEQNIYRIKIERMKRGEKIWLPEQY